MLPLSIHKERPVIHGHEFKKLIQLDKYLQGIETEINKCPVHKHKIISGYVDIASQPWVCHLLTCCPQMLITLEMVLQMDAVQFYIAYPGGVNDDTSELN